MIFLKENIIANVKKIAWQSSKYSEPHLNTVPNSVYCDGCVYMKWHNFYLYCIVAKPLCSGDIYFLTT